LCKEIGLSSIPSRSFILKQEKKPTKKMKEILSIKPTRTLSGVQVVAVMLPPFDCPGECIYCPSSFEGKKSPQSYTGFEPSSLRAQRLNFDPFAIVSNRISQFDSMGHRAEKIELIFQGSSFTCLPKKKQEIIIKKSIDAVTEKKSLTFKQAKKNAENSKRRIVGMTFETRPDYCSKKDIEQMLYLGGTRVEIGVQNPDEEVYSRIKRGHTINDVVNSTRLLKDSGFKVLYHLMPGLPGSDYKKDLKNFKSIFTNQDFMPDMVKFYPCLVIKGTKLYDEWKKGEFVPLDEKKAVKMLAEIKETIPKWVRIMRVNRDIPSNVISGGIQKTNLRQFVHEEMKKSGTKCNCIRCREIGLKSRGDKEFDLLSEKPRLEKISYNASNGEETFISFESKNYLFGFVRVRKPFEPFMKQITDKTALIREIHVYGQALELGKKDPLAAQHRGLGKLLMQEAENTARGFGANKMVVISGLGVREYYKKNFGYKIEEPFVSKKI